MRGVTEVGVSGQLSPIPSDIADIDALMARYGQKADEAPSAEDAEFAQSALPVDWSAEFHGVMAECGQLGGESLYFRHPGGRPPVTYSALGL